MTRQWNRLSARERWTVALGATIVIGSLVGFRVVPAWLAWRTQAVRAAAESLEELARAEATLARFPASLDTLEARIARLRQLDEALLVGGEPAELGATLANIVRGVARRSSVRVEGVDVELDDDGRGRALRRISVRVQAMGDVTGLASLLRRLEGGLRPLAVRDVEVQPQSVLTPADQPETLSLRFTVEALVLVR